MVRLQHESDAHSTQELSYLLSEFGAEGYGVFWIILEKIARNSMLNPGKNQSDSAQFSARFTAKKWAAVCEVSPQKFRKITSFLSQNISGFMAEDQGKYIKIEHENLILTQGRPKGKRQ